MFPAEIVRGLHRNTVSTRAEIVWNVSREDMR